MNVKLKFWVYLEMDRNPLEPSSKLRELNIAFNNIRKHIN